MRSSTPNSLSGALRPVMMHVPATSAVFASLLLFSSLALGAEKNAGTGDDLDVTMQIITDPNAKQPDEIVRRIPIPARKPVDPATGATEPGKKDKASDASAKGQERAREAQDLGKEMSQRAKERAQDANDQREQARRAVVDERRRNPPHPPEPPGRPPH